MLLSIDPAIFKHDFWTSFQRITRQDLLIRARALQHPRLNGRPRCVVHQPHSGHRLRQTAALLCSRWQEATLHLFSTGLHWLVSWVGLCLSFVKGVFRGFFSLLPSLTGYWKASRYILDSSTWTSSITAYSCSSHAAIFFRYPCALKYCRNREGEGEHRCGIRTCRKCTTYRFPTKFKNLCLWDEV